MPEILSIGELLDLGNVHNSAYIPYSGLEYNASGAISGISGSAIAGGIESSVVSSIVSSMVSGKADQSAVEDCCSAMFAEVSAKLDATASSLFQPSGNYQPSGDYYSATNPSGFITTADLTDYAKESALSSKLDASASSNFAPSGDYIYESSYSSFTSEVTNNITSISSTVSGLTGDYLEKSASSMFAPSGEYAYESSLSSYIPESASGQFAPSGSYADSSALSSYIPYSAVSGEDSQITAINGSAIAGGGGGGIDSATCSAIASSYAESAVSSKANSSSLSSYVPYSSLKNGPTTATISAIDSSAVYDYSAHARISTLSTSRIPYSALDYSGDRITSISGSAVGYPDGGATPPTTELIVNSAQMSASTAVDGIYIGIRSDVYTPVVIVANSSQATANDVVYVVTGA